MRTRMRVRFQMRVRAVYCECMDFLTFWWFYCPHLTILRGFPVTFGIYSDHPVRVRRLMWIVAWSLLLLSWRVPLFILGQNPSKNVCIVMNMNMFLSSLKIFFNYFKMLCINWFWSIVTFCCEKKIIKKTCHYENTPVQIYWEFYYQKIKTFRWKFLVVFKFLLKTYM